MLKRIQGLYGLPGSSLRGEPPGCVPERAEVNLMFMFNLQRFAHKKGVSSTRNGRDSESKRLGVKEQAGTLVTAGSILVRQRGTHFHPGHNVGIGKDDTLFAKVAGKVAFERKGKYNRQISVYTAEEAM